MKKHRRENVQSLGLTRLLHVPPLIFMMYYFIFPVDTIRTVSEISLLTMSMLAAFEAQ